MTKSELVRTLAETNPELRHQDIEAIVTLIFRRISDALALGDRVELRGFGTFSVRHRRAHRGRNPRNGVTVAVPDKHVPFFKTGKLLHDRLNRPDSRPTTASTMIGVGR